tara:strand:+ start:2747 stop:2998 length:252 start_codon:yes stop_codon:yes gene_type:complete
MDMTRYTTYLKEKILCNVCDRIISRGHINNHLKSKIHKKNLNRENKDDADDEDGNIKIKSKKDLKKGENKDDEDDKKYIITWD